MTDLSKPLRLTLKEKATIGDIITDHELRSRDGTIKRLYRLNDNKLVESVLMPYSD